MVKSRLLACALFACCLCLLALLLPGWSFPQEVSLARYLAGGLRPAGAFVPLAGLVALLAGGDLFSLPGLLEGGLPSSLAWSPQAVLATSPAAAGGETGDRGERALEEKDAQEKEVVVAFYHTHNSETYVPLDGKSRREGENGGVSLVAAEMAKVLQGLGFRVVHDMTIHDYPDFPLSYIKSEATARRILKENPGLCLLVDVHRDAGLSRKEVVKVGGKDVARLLFIVGTGERLPNPAWRENYAFAQKVAHKLEEEYPGLVKGVRLRPGRYNQHLGVRSLLVEVGSDKNTLAEAEAAARCFASALAAVLKEEGVLNTPLPSLEG